MLNAKPRTIDQASGKWQGILAALGVDEYFLSGKHRPCPLCKSGKDRFRFDDKEGTGSFFCSQCGIYTHHQRRSNPNQYGVNVACLEGVSPFDFAQVPVMDGMRHPSDNAGEVRRIGVETITFEAPCSIVFPAFEIHQLANTGGDVMEALTVLPAGGKVYDEHGIEMALPWRE